MKISRGVTPVKGECQFGFRLTAPETSEQPHSGSKGRLRFEKPSSGLRVSCPAAQNGRASTFRSSLTQQQKAGALYRARTVHLWTTLRPPGLALNEKQIPRFVGNSGNASRKWNAWNELSCAQGRRANYKISYRAPPIRCWFAQEIGKLCAAQEFAEPRKR